jgi:hypothetical protein
MTTRMSNSYTLSRLVMCGAVVGAVACFSPAQPAFAQISYNREPINYSSAVMTDPVARLQERIDTGETQLDFDENHGYLKAVLDELKVLQSSQSLVFSKTSFQLRRISPRTPRAVYFSDDAYVGWVQHGDVVELSAVDPQHGAVFYTLRQEETDRPKFVRDRGNCLVCHASSRTQGVPGHLVRSVYSSPSGMPNFGSGTFRTNHSSPLSQRWGGWYVSGTHGRQRHMGNVVTPDRSRPEEFDREEGANVTDLAKRFDTSPYLTRDSDIVALMVLEHQTDMHNFITYANFQCRLAQQNAEIMNRALERPKDFVSDSTQRRIASAAEKLVRYTLFVDETELTDKIQGPSKFTESFARLGPRDRKGRSLRQFDLSRRLFKYPCSYLIYSDAFRGLPKQIKDVVYRRLWEVLSGEDQSEPFSHLSKDDRVAILDILRETNCDVPDYFKGKKQPQR